MHPAMLQCYMSPFWNFGDLPGDGRWLSLGWWVTILRMVADRPKDSRWLSWGWWVTVLSRLGDRMWHSWKSGIDRRTNRQPDKQTDTTVYRVTPQLKLGKIGKNSQLGLSTPPPTLLINQNFFNIRMFYKITTSSPLTNFRNNCQNPNSTSIQPNIT